MLDALREERQQPGVAARGLETLLEHARRDAAQHAAHRFDVMTSTVGHAHDAPSEDPRSTVGDDSAVLLTVQESYGFNLLQWTRS